MIWFDLIWFKIHWLHVPALSNKSPTSSSKSNLKFEEDDCYCYCNDDIEDEDEEDDDRMIAVATARMIAWDRRNSNLNCNRRNCDNFREHSTSPGKAFSMGWEASSSSHLDLDCSLALARGLDLSTAISYQHHIIDDDDNVWRCGRSILFCSRRGTAGHPVADHQKPCRADLSISAVFAGWFDSFDSIHSSVRTQNYY